MTALITCWRSAGLRFALLAAGWLDARGKCEVAGCDEGLPTTATIESQTIAVVKGHELIVASPASVTQTGCQPFCILRESIGRAASGG